LDIGSANVGWRPHASRPIVIGAMEAVFLHADRWAEYFRGVPLDRGRVLAIVARDPHSGNLLRVARAATDSTLRAIRYDPDRDVVELGVGGAVGLGPALRYSISAPRRIVVEESPQATRILIEDAAGMRTTIALSRMSVTRDPSPDPMPMGFALGLPSQPDRPIGERTARRSVCPQSRPGAACARRTQLRRPRRGKRLR
jgi:hypothetical protein